MVRRLRGGEGVEFEGEIGVAGGNQFVIHLLSRYAEMTGEAGLGADLQILGIDHAGLDAGLVRILARVRAEPVFGGAVTGFAGDTIRTRLFGRSRDMADSAAFFVRGVGDPKDLRHPLTARLREGLVCAGVLVGYAPVGIFVAQDAALAREQCGGAAMAVGGGTAAGSDIPMRCRLRQRVSRNRQQNQELLSYRLHFKIRTTISAMARIAAIAIARYKGQDPDFAGSAPAEKGV